MKHKSDGSNLDKKSIKMTKKTKLKIKLNSTINKLLNKPVGDRFARC